MYDVPILMQCVFFWDLNLNLKFKWSQEKVEIIKQGEGSECAFVNLGKHLFFHKVRPTGEASDIITDVSEISSVTRFAKYPNHYYSLD